MSEVSTKAADTGSTSNRGKFWNGVKQEFRKIIWPNKPTLIKNSASVVIVSVILGAIIAIVDRVILYGVNFLVK